MRAGFECGVGISNFNDVKVGDILECFKMEKTRRLECERRTRPAQNARSKPEVTSA